MAPKGTAVESAELKRRFGGAIRRRRLLMRLGQEDFADLAGIHRTTLSLLERGKHMPNLEMVGLLAAAFEVKMAVLVAEAEDTETPLPNPPGIKKGRPPKSGTVARKPKPKK